MTGSVPAAATGPGLRERIVRVIPPEPTGHRCDLPRSTAGYGSTGYLDGTLVQCGICGRWWQSLPCFRSLGPTSEWRLVRRYSFAARRRISALAKEATR